MEEQIVRKLREALCDEVSKEKDVVYILVESRKLLDDTKPGQPHFALKLYCHWALHVDLMGRDTTLPFLERLDGFVASVLAGNTSVVEEHRMLREFIFLDTFREQLRQFLASYGLPTAVCDENPRWHAFLNLYAGIVEDGTLSCNAQPGDLKLVSGVNFTKGKPASGSYLPFEMVWDIRLLNGKTITVNVRAMAAPGGDEMLFQGLHLH